MTRGLQSKDFGPGWGQEWETAWDSEQCAFFLPAIGNSRTVPDGFGEVPQHLEMELAQRAILIRLHLPGDLPQCLLWRKGSFFLPKALF